MVSFSKWTKNKAQNSKVWNVLLSFCLCLWQLQAFWNLGCISAQLEKSESRRTQFIPSSLPLNFLHLKSGFRSESLGLVPFWISSSACLICLSETIQPCQNTETHTKNTSNFRWSQRMSWHVSWSVPSQQSEPWWWQTNPTFSTACCLVITLKTH